MTEVFSETVDDTPFRAIVPAVLRSTALPLPASRAGERLARARGDAAYWSNATAGMDFIEEDHLPSERFNEVLRQGLGLVDVHGSN